MTRLVKIELKKLFSKKIIYIFLIVLFSMNIGTALLEKYVTKIIGALQDSTNEELYKQSMEAYDLSKPEEVKYYADDKTYYETIKLSKGYDISSAEYMYIFEEIQPSIECMNENEFINKDQEAYDECKATYDEQVAFLKAFDWKKVVEDKRKQTQDEIDGVKALLEMGGIDKEAADMQLKVLKLKMEVFDYRLKHEIPIENSVVSSELESYPNLYQNYLSIDNEKNVVDYNEKLLRQDTKKSYFITKYKYEHELIQKRKNKNFTSSTTADAVLGVFSGGMMSVLFLVLVAGGIIAEEYNKGTIKQLLLKPYTRAKILTSKVLTVIITFALFMFVYALMTGLINGIIFGDFKSLFDPVLIYDFNKDTVIEVNLFIRCCQLFLSVLPMFLILLGISLLVAIITTNTSVALVVPLVVTIVSSIIQGLAKGKIFAYIPTMCWNLSEFLNGGLPYFQYSTFCKSLIVDVVTIFVLFFISYVIFKRKDIKNQ